MRLSTSNEVYAGPPRRRVCQAHYLAGNNSMEAAASGRQRPFLDCIHADQHQCPRGECDVHLQACLATDARYQLTQVGHGSCLRTHESVGDARNGLSTSALCCGRRRSTSFANAPSEAVSRPRRSIGRSCQSPIRRQCAPFARKRRWAAERWAGRRAAGGRSASPFRYCALPPCRRRHG